VIGLPVRKGPAAGLARVGTGLNFPFGHQITPTYRAGCNHRNPFCSRLLPACGLQAVSTPERAETKRLPCGLPKDEAAQILPLWNWGVRHRWRDGPRDLRDQPFPEGNSSFQNIQGRPGA
jgi:hypothetical protein